MFTYALNIYQANLLKNEIIVKGNLGYSFHYKKTGGSASIAVVLLPSSIS